MMNLMLKDSTIRGGVTNSILRRCAAAPRNGGRQNEGNLDDDDSTRRLSHTISRFCYFTDSGGDSFSSCKLINLFNFFFFRFSL